MVKTATVFVFACLIVLLPGNVATFWDRLINVADTTVATGQDPLGAVTGPAWVERDMIGSFPTEFAHLQVCNRLQMTRTPQMAWFPITYSRSSLCGRDAEMPMSVCHHQVDNKTQETQALQDAIRQPDKRQRNAISQLANNGICCIDRGPCTSLRETVPNDHTCAQCYTTRSSNWLATSTKHPHTHSNQPEVEQPYDQPRPLREPTVHALHAGLLPRTRYPHTHGNQPEDEQPNDQPMTPLGSALHAVHADLLYRTRYPHAYNNNSESVRRCVQPTTLPGADTHAAHAGELPRIRFSHAYNNKSESVQRGAQPTTLPGAAMHAAHADLLPRTRYPHTHSNQSEDEQPNGQPRPTQGTTLHAAHADLLPRTRYPHAYNNNSESVRRCVQPTTLPGAATHAVHAGLLPRTRYPHTHSNQSEDEQPNDQPMTPLGSAMHALNADLLPRTRYPHTHSNQSEDEQPNGQPRPMQGTTLRAVHADLLPRTRYPHAYNNNSESVRRCVQPTTLPGAATHAVHADLLPRTRYPHTHSNQSEDEQPNDQPMTPLGSAMHALNADLLPRTRYPHTHSNQSEDEQPNGQPRPMQGTTLRAVHADLLPRTRYPHAYNNNSESVRRCVQPTTLPGAATHAAHADLLPRTRYPHAYNNNSKSVRRCVQPTTLPGAATHAVHADLLPRTRYPHTHSNQSEDEQPNDQPMTPLGSAMHALNADLLPRTRYPHTHSNQSENEQPNGQPRPMQGTTLRAVHADLLNRTRYPHAYNNKSESVQRCAQPATLPGAAMHAAHAGALPRTRYPHAYNWSERVQRCVQPTTLPGAATHAAHAGLLPRARYPHAYNNNSESVRRCVQPTTLPGAATHAAHADLLPRTKYPHTHSNQSEDEQPNGQPRPMQGTTLHAAHADLLYHHLPALTAMPKANQQPQHDGYMPGAHTIGQRMVPETNIAEVPCLFTYSDNMDPQYTIITPMPNPPFGHPNWKPTQQNDMDRQTIAYLVCFLTWIMISRKRNEPTYTHAKSKECLKKQRKTLAKLNASLHTTTYNWLLGIDGSLQSATTITRLTHTTCTYLKGHNSGRTIRAIQYNTTLQAYMTYYLNPNIISNPTWNMAISKYMARCIYISWLLLAAGDIEENPGPDGLHFEQQVASHCQIHALNMAAGHSWLTNQELANFHTSELHARRGDQRTMWALARDEQGACNDTVINLYLMSHYGLSTHTVAHLRTRRDWSICNLDALSVTHGTNAFLCKAPAHSMAVRKHNGAWYLLDSQADAPIRLRNTRHYAYPVTCEIQAIISASDYTAEMEEARQRARLGPIIGNPQEAHRPYWEKQYKKCCLAHAINMAMGKPMIRPDDVITHCKTLGTHIQNLANQARQEGRPIPLRSSLPHIYEESGNFTVSTMNHYLYHYHKDLHLCPIATDLTLGNITPELLTTLTGNIDSYTSTAAILITNNHATTIRRTDRAWQWLDSERGHPCRLDTPEDWLQLQGTLVQIKKGDAANTNLIQPLCWLADPTRHATTEQLEHHLRAAHIDLTSHDWDTQPAHSPGRDRPTNTADTAQQPTSNTRTATTNDDTHPPDQHVRPQLRQAAPTVTLPTSAKTRNYKRPTSTGHTSSTTQRRHKSRAQPKDSHTQTLMYRYLKTDSTPPPDAIPTDTPSENLAAQPQHRTLPSRQPHPTHNRQHITLTTLNVRSLHRSRNDVLNLVHKHSPDILILTETMTQPRSNNPDSGWLKRVMPDYMTHRHSGHSEVLIGIKHNLAIQMQTKMLPPCTDAEVNARCVILTLNQHQCEQLTIIATYWPSGNNGDALSLREKMQQHIRTATSHLPGSLILAGDINATLRTADRSEHTDYTQDLMMRDFATEMRLLEADPDDRAWTYQQPHCNSRIDAILTRDARHGPEHRTHVKTHAYLSDHRPVTATLSTARLGVVLADPQKPHKHSHTILTTPITNKDREAYRLAVQQPSSGAPQLHAQLTAYLAPMYTEATRFLTTLDKTNPHQPQRLSKVTGLPAREVVDTAATMLTTLLETCRATAIQTCNTKILTRGGQHYQRRTMCRIRLALGKKLKTTRNLSRQARLLFKQNGAHPTIEDLIPETDTTNTAIREAVLARQDDDPTENHVQAALAKLTNSYRDQIHQLDDDDSALAIAQARVRMQQLISTQPKKANKYILRPSRTDHKGLQALADPDTKNICTAPADLNRIITAAYGQKLSPPTPKTGHYTDTQSRNYPWARAKADDPFSLHTCKNIHWLHTAIMDKAGFQECLSRLAGGKAPGPDGIENEIIKMLPWEMRDTIHQLFIIMWATGCTPSAWKTSDTCLLYKDKGQETDLNAYRPVGLANTIYKLWTSLITKTLYEYAEANGMLSNCQAGFRSHRDTTQQLQMLVMALEDAKLAKTDIYALLVDFTSAFNTTCQDKLLWIMHDLGFPTDATDAVKDLYTGATTRFKTPYGHTDPVPVDRGTIQGDSLSPFLFLIYIEPLLRWLQVGARGYKFTSETTASAGRYTIGSIDYADDIAILCNSISNLRCQADKLSAYSDWGHLIISHSKTLATAALHKAHQSGRCSTLADAEKQARRELQHVRLQGKPVTYLPPTAPFAYLGVLLTMTLNWKPQHMAMAAQLKQKLERLRRSFASARQAIHIIKTAIIPSLAYSFCVVPCTPGDLDLYDRAVNQCVKKKLRLPLGTTNAVIREDIDKLGLGISSTAQEYHARNTTALIHSLQSADDTHAHITRNMLHKQITWLYAQAAKHGHRMLSMLQHTLRARQLLHATTAQLKATHQGEELYPKETKLLGQLITQDNSPLPHDIVNASITCLKSLGIKHASELQQAIADDTYIISGKMLKDRFGNKVKQKHYIALNKLAAMASRDKCPTAIEAKAIADKRDTTLNLPAAQRKIKHWAAGLTELAPIVAEEDSKHRYADIRSYAVAKQPPTQPPAQEPTAECAHQPDDTRRRSSRLRNKALNPPPTTPQPKPPPKIGNKRQADDRHTQTIPETVVHIPIMTLESLSSWKVNAACGRNAKELGITLGAMYDHQESITKIDGWHWNGINKESYYNVHWRPTIIEKWALPMCKEEGYTPMHTEDISRADAKHACTCELCWEPIGDSPMCNSCMRAYHPACLAQTGLAGKTANNHWLCPVCAHGSDDLKGDMKQSAATDLLQVHWHPTTEPKALIQAHIDYTAKQKEYDAENNRRQGTGRPPPDAGLPGHTRQGLPDPHTWMPRCIDLHSKATFQVSPVNPQTDIEGTGRCETTIQQHAHITTPATSEGSQGPTLPQYSLPTHVIAHDEAGRTVGLITKSKQQDLATWLQHTPHPRDHATEMVALLRRHDTQNTPQPIQAAQDQAISTLYNTHHFPSTVQRWANPLTVRAETTTYWSPDINDTAYGAHHNCLLVRHTGLSTWNVPAEDAIALKCIRHAIHSATQEEAMATILLIPGKKGISYPKHIDMLRSYPEYCQHIATIPLNKPNAAAKSDKHAKLITYIVWNQAGQQLVTHGNPQGWLANTATALHPRLRTHPALAKPSQHNQPTPLPSGNHKHRGLPADHELPSTGHTRQTNQPAFQPTTPTHRAIPEWKKVTYTDGSCIKGTEGASVGAGVYTPASDARITIALAGDTTINRAELIAILSALQAGAKRIATDSLCSLYQIRRALANPMSLRTHRHKDILAKIATILTNSQDTVHFFKVRAHSGIIGNEGADALAKHAARHPEQATTPGPCPPRHTEQHAWLSTTSELNVTTPLPDCRHSVRAHMSNKHKLGLANQESIYYQMSREITKAAAKGSCERVMTDAGIPTEAQRTALLYRTGGLYNQKLAMRWGKAADDRCPLCGEADSATHLLSGCSRTSALVQERHNGAGRLITKAISKGAQGGCIRFADIGSHERGETEGIDLPSATLRKALEVLSLSARDTNTTTRPDIIMINNTKKRKQGSNESTKHVTLLEINLLPSTSTSTASCDFNCILAPVDRVGIPQGSQHGEAWVGSRGQGGEQLRQLVGERGLVDPWRHLYPSKRDLTHFSERWQTGARLDRWYISEELVQWQMDSAIQGVLPVPTDHRPVSVAVCPPDLPLTVPAPWQLHPAHLDNPDLLDCLKDFLQAEAHHHEAASQLGLPRDGHRARWARIKQGLAMRAQHFLRAQRRTQRDLQQRREKAAAVARAHLVRQLVRVEREGEAEVQAAQHLGEAAALAGVGAREQGAQQSLLASAVLDQYYGDRSSFYFYHRDQPAHTPTLISSLQLPGQPGQPADLTTPAGVKAACRAFQQRYSAAEPTGAYAAKPVDTAARATLLGSLTSHLTPTQARAAEGPDGSPMLSEEELGRALQGCAHSKAPGLDGLPMEVYDRLWVELGRPLRAMLREALADTADPFFFFF
ncbi:hypothetical protein QJQ45_002805 [Haematococcus lacustris]|nr:hypothetical protein QJQ45_002805 [Haematococcus lacustris]